MAFSMLFMPSTPLNVLVSATVALQFPESEKQIWLIDQKNGQPNLYYEALLEWKDSPFMDVQIFCAQAKGLRDKLCERRHTFTDLQTKLNIFKPNVVAVGSDRRVEFQFVMAHLLRRGQPSRGIYLDDGLYSYVGRAPSLFKDGLNSFLKKMAYGFWWEEPVTVGASSLIQEAWLFEPEQAVAALQEKQLVQLRPEWFKQESLTSLSLTLTDKLGIDFQSLIELDELVMVAHPNNLKKMPGRAEQIQTYVKTLQAAGRLVGVKYHPRSQNDDFLMLKACGAKVILPNELAFEFVLPMLKEGCKVAADVGTVLLTTKWLRPDVAVVAILDENDHFQQAFIPIFNRMNIPVVSNYLHLLS